MPRLPLRVAASACALLTLQAAVALGAHPAEPSHEVPHVAWGLPFGLLLAAIAVLPLLGRTHHWWERNRSKLLVGLVLGGLVLAHYATRGHGYHGAEPGASSVLAVLHHSVLGDYVPFVTLLFSLYVIAGGLRLTGDLPARPVINSAILGLGALLASLIGTTGASMVLIRPLLQTNRERVHVRHTVLFFIFLVSNVGGCLLPIGDPPLFLGYLQGVPFLWTLNLVGPWAVCVTTILATYYVWDRLAYRRETPRDLARDESIRVPVRLRGTINVVWLALAVLSVALIVPGRPLPGTTAIVPDYAREAVLLILAGLSLATTPRGLRRELEFNYTPIAEVACLFLGIFVTMQPPLELLEARGGDLPLSTPASFYWSTGALSSVLDNAPTYLVFLQLAQARQGPAEGQMVPLSGGRSVPQSLLAAISLGAVFFGACTYIGNGPNFMVKAIAERQGVAMPGFFGYMGYSLVVLLPPFLLVRLIFL
ncbi:sodium:proton antiporter [Isosphaeraceae bacterium EP7]